MFPKFYLWLLFQKNMPRTKYDDIGDFRLIIYCKY